MDRVLSSVCMVAVVVGGSACITVKPTAGLYEAVQKERAEAHAKDPDGPVPSIRFRTNEPDDATARALKSVTALCGDATVQDGVVRSSWRRTDRRDLVTRVYERCLVALAPNEADRSMDVRASVELADCPRIKNTEDGLAKANVTASEVEARCKRRDSVPQSWSAAYAATLARLQDDVFRR